ncbi:MAG: hypothetical protein KA793_07825 [Bacteroidales bacterium]|nr:hypothetical protein [Bacteroidales bacterium]
MNLKKPIQTPADEVVLIHYSGDSVEVNHSTLLAQLSGSKELSRCSKLLLRKIVWVSNELISNMLQHGIAEHSDKNLLEIRFSLTRKTIRLITENLLPTDDALALSERIQKIALMNNNEVTSAYHGVLQVSVETSKNAGLGLLGIARKGGFLACTVYGYSGSLALCRIEAIIQG